jgi:hypothetical protein
MPGGAVYLVRVLWYATATVAEWLLLVARAFAGEDSDMIRKLASGKYRLYSRKKDPKTGKRRNLGTFNTRAAAEKHERAVQFFKRRG